MNKTPGIYCITNTTNNKVYVGSTVNLHRRCVAHLRLLRANKHHSPKLQAAWNKYGELNFTFKVLVECEKENLILLEQSFMDKFDSATNGYNVCMIAGCNPAKLSNIPHLSRKHSEETKAKMSLASKGKKKKPLTEEHKEKLRRSQLGRRFTQEEKLAVSIGRKGIPMSEETKIKISNSRREIKLSNIDKYRRKSKVVVQEEDTKME